MSECRAVHPLRDSVTHAPSTLHEVFNPLEIPQFGIDGVEKRRQMTVIKHRDNIFVSILCQTYLRNGSHFVFDVLFCYLSIEMYNFPSKGL